MVLLNVFLATTVVCADVSQPSVFGSNMVLQCDMPVPIWGAAEPGETVTVEFATMKAETVADRTGDWKVMLGPFEAGGPFVMTIRGADNKTVLRNVMVGEVWVASGQSNMQVQVTLANNAENEVSAADYPSIRLHDRLTSVSYDWAECSPETVAQFSGVAYFFGRELHQALDVPVGLIWTASGGSPAAAWTSRCALKSVPALEYLAEAAEEDERKYSAAVENHPNEHDAWQVVAEKAKRACPFKGVYGVGSRGLFIASGFADMWDRSLPAPGPKGAGTAPSALYLDENGVQSTKENSGCWTGMRSDGSIGAHGAALNAGLGGVQCRIAMLANEAYAWLDWVPTPATSEKRNIYAISEVITVPEPNTRKKTAGPWTPPGLSPGNTYQLAFVTSEKIDALSDDINVYNEFVNGLAQASPLTAGPEYKAMVSTTKVAARDNAFVAQGPEAPPEPRPPTISDKRAGNLFNANISPIVPYGIRGVIWYQGEADVPRAKEYRTLFPMLIKDWRDHWGQGDFPFLFVQLPNIGPPPDDPWFGLWPELREAQRSALNVANTGMAVTIDVGEANNIHPRNKQDVGKRLAFWALGTTYGRKTPISGPLYESTQIEGGKIRIRFEHIDGGLVAKDGVQPTGFAIAGEDGKFVPADAEIDDDTVVVSSPRVTAPVAVRYAWADDPKFNLYNATGLPAAPFGTDE